MWLKTWYCGSSLKPEIVKFFLQAAVKTMIDSWLQFLFLLFFYYYFLFFANGETVMILILLILYQDLALGHPNVQPRKACCLVTFRIVVRVIVSEIWILDLDTCQLWACQVHMQRIAVAGLRALMYPDLHMHGWRCMQSVDDRNMHTMGADIESRSSWLLLELAAETFWYAYATTPTTMAF